MIKTAKEQHPGEFFPATKWTCPKCGYSASFYSTPPHCCIICRKELPNLIKLRDLLEYRVIYHREV